MSSFRRVALQIQSLIHPLGECGADFKPVAIAFADFPVFLPAMAGVVFEEKPKLLTAAAVFEKLRRFILPNIQDSFWIWFPPVLK